VHDHRVPHDHTHAHIGSVIEQTAADHSLYTIDRSETPGYMYH